MVEHAEYHKVCFLIASSIIWTYFMFADAKTVTDVDYGSSGAKRKNYTIAIFKDNWPTYTAAISESVSDLNLPKPSVYKPLLKPGEFTVTGEFDDTHEGEVFSHNEDSLNPVDTRPVPTNLMYQTINEEDIQHSVEHPIPENIVHSYFPIDSYESMVSYSNASVRPESYVNSSAYPNPSNFSGYPESLQPVSSVSITESWQLTPVLGGNVLLHDAGVVSVNGNNSDQVHVKHKFENSFTKLYLGHKLWYSAVFFAIFQAVTTLVYHLSLLARHYSQFPGAFHEAALNYSGAKS